MFDILNFIFFSSKNTFVKYPVYGNERFTSNNYRWIKFIAGHPQVIKVVQSTPTKALSGIVSTTNAGGLKVFKAPNQETQVFTSFITIMIFDFIITEVKYRNNI